MAEKKKKEGRISYRLKTPGQRYQAPESVLSSAAKIEAAPAAIATAPVSTAESEVRKSLLGGSMQFGENGIEMAPIDTSNIKLEEGTKKLPSRKVKKKKS